MDLIDSSIIHKIKEQTQTLNLCNGYCRISRSIPNSITYLIAIFYFIPKIMIIGKLIFTRNYIRFTSLTASILIRNPIFKINIKIGSVIIKLFLNQNRYNTNLVKNSKIIRTISGNPWSYNYVINKCHIYYKPKQYRIIFLINRQTECNCVNSNYQIKIFILNFITKFNCSLYALCRDLEIKHDENLYNQNGNGLIKIKLESDVEIEDQEIKITMNGNDLATIEICDVIDGRICCWDADKRNSK